jgi:SAM-dependent methyltransferase
VPFRILMDPSLYPRMAEVEDAHWWFAARRAIVDRMIAELELPPDAAILEPGCGTGGNFAMLARRGRLYAMDSDASAIGFAGRRGLAQLARGTLPGDVPFGDLRFDLVVMTDVLEHLDDPGGALGAVRARLKPGGALLMTVPATPWLWSAHDVTHHHRRRYRARELRRIVIDAGFEVSRLTYYNFMLFPAIAGARLLQRLRARQPLDAGARHDLAMPPAALNSLLRRIFAGERYLLGRIPVPFGVSLIVIARAPQTASATSAAPLPASSAN